MASLCFYFCLPQKLFKAPTSTILYSSNDDLLSAKIATDGQWRFPEADSVPQKFSQCLTTFEDEYFNYHLGINPFSLAKAFFQNLKQGRIKRGGSTITMQLMRMARGNRHRTYYQKLVEIIWSLRIELGYSKKEILSLYASHAPFGGNVVGLDAASWRYFNRPSHLLSWAESACLAVLPNAPSLIFPGKNQDQLLKKRNNLLFKLLEKELIDSLTYELALEEHLPQKPFSLPNNCYHFIEYIEKNGDKGELVHSSIEKELQYRVDALLNQESDFLQANRIMNGAVLVVENKTKEVKCYVANTKSGEDHAAAVDMVQSARSSGSILKPILYASMIDDGLIMPKELIPDIPINISGYSPKNFDYKFRGAVPANKALSMSLNIPAVKMLQTYGVNRFYDVLKKTPLSSINRSADNYGLSLILGGAETKLWDLVCMYSGMASSLMDTTDFTIHNLAYNEPATQKWKVGLSHSSLWHTMEAMRLLKRPEEEKGWEYFKNDPSIAWKTGTSFGFRDAWAIGFTPDYTVGVWIGNADGEGRPHLTGTSCAAPILFKVFGLLKRSEKEFQKPLYQMTDLKVCQKSGQKANTHCENSTWERVANSCQKSEVCNYCNALLVTENEDHQVYQNCSSTRDIKEKVYFTLPPLQAWYYQKYVTDYEPIPPLSESCLSNDSKKVMDFVYPRGNETIFLPVNLEREKESLILKVIHQKTESELFWYLDNDFLGTTKGIHHIKINPKTGEYTIMVMDSEGNQIRKRIKIK